MPIGVSLQGLDEDALVKVLTEPKNAIIKQYERLFEMDGVELQFEDEAVRAIAKKAHERKTGARGLRSILEKLMLELMYEIPSDPRIHKVVITASAVENGGEPLIMRRGSKLKKAE